MSGTPATTVFTSVICDQAKIISAHTTIRPSHPIVFPVKACDKWVSSCVSKHWFSCGFVLFFSLVLLCIFCLFLVFSMIYCCQRGRWELQPRSMSDFGNCFLHKGVCDYRTQVWTWFGLQVPSKIRTKPKYFSIFWCAKNKVDILGHLFKKKNAS